MGKVAISHGGPFLFGPFDFSRVRRPCVELSLDCWEE